MRARSGYKKNIRVKVALLLVFVFMLVPLSVFAREDTDVCKVTEADVSAKKAIEVLVPIPGITYKVNNNHYTKDMGCYIVGIYRYFAGVAGILATVMIMYGGVQYVISLGNQQKLSQAKDTITGAIMGLVLVLGSYSILYLINPNLISFDLRIIDEGIPAVPENIVWCEDYTDDPVAVPDKVDEKDCGDTGLVEINGIQTVCTYHGTCHNSNEICTPWQPRYECKHAQAACENYSSSFGSCEAIDELMSQQGFANKVCTTKTMTTLGGSEKKCAYEDLMTCPGEQAANWLPGSSTKNFIQIPCEVGTTTSWTNGCFIAADETEVVVSSRGKPKSNGTKTCIDKGLEGVIGRPGNGADMICCGDILDINCRSFGATNPGDYCNDNEIEAPEGTCELYGASYVKGEDVNAPESSCTRGQLDSLNFRCCFEADMIF